MCVGVCVCVREREREREGEGERESNKVLYLIKLQMLKQKCVNSVYFLLHL